MADFCWEILKVGFFVAGAYFLAHFGWYVGELFW